MEPLSNQLAKASSPYLIQHKDNPVHWQVWSEDVFLRAKAENKPVLLSVGYAACHWCHVMAHESFEDARIAGLMNDLFINVKVDREEHPEVDAIYQQALALMGGQGGWPLTMFLTPEGEPYFGGTYFPPTERYGRPGFDAVLSQLAQLFHQDKERVETNRKAIVEALDKLANETAGDTLPQGLNEAVARKLVRQVDPFWGGIGDAPKFPQSPAMELLLRAFLRTGQQPYRQAVQTTLIHMMEGGIYDHLGGGFARYSVDDQWLVPHFEKMLYDNAGLLELMALWHQLTGDRLTARRMRETADWTVREMQLEGGGFGSTYDADSEGEEGKFYVWSVDEITALLGEDDGAFFAAHYDVTERGNFEGHTILNRLHQPGEVEDDTEARLKPLREILFKARSKRIWPGFDDKVLADWNGLMIAALVRVAEALGEPAYVEAAIRAYDFVTTTQMVDGRIRHAWRNGVLSNNELLEDYANLSMAALRLFEHTSEPRFLDDAERFTHVLDEHFWDTERGGYFMTPHDAKGLITRPRPISDQAVPAGNGTMMHVLSHLGALTGKPNYAARAHKIVKGFAKEFERNPFGPATFLNGFEALNRPIQIVLVGEPGEPGFDALRSVTRKAAIPDKIVMAVSETGALPTFHPAKGKDKVDGKPSAFVCIGQSCSLPVTDADDLQELLSPQNLWSQ